MIAGITEKEQKIIERILDKYCKDYAFFYYGSRVKGTYEKTSDLDVLIKGKTEMPLAVLQEIKEEFDKSDLPYIVNFSDYYKLDSSFYERIKPDLIPYNWREVKLGDICRFQNGYAFKSSQFTNNGNIKIIKIKEIKEGKIIFFDDSASVFYNDKYKKYQVENDDILVALTGDPVARPNPASWVGRIAIFRGSEKALINQRVAKFLPNKTVLFPLFIYYFFRDFNNFYNLAKKATGSASQANISTNMLENTEILLPPLEVQKKIAGVLGALDDKIELNNKINQNLEAQAQALFKSWFVDFEPFGGQMPSDWKIGKLDDIVDFYNGYPFKSNELLDKNVEGRCLHVFKQGHIKRGGGFNSDSTKSYFPKEKTKDKEKYILKKGDILMAMTDMKGNVAILGNTALMGTSDKFIVNQRVGLLRCKNIYGISYPYIYLLTNSTDFLHDLRNRANSGVQVNLSSQEIKNSELLIPDTKTNTVFNTVSKTFFEKIFENEKENIRLAELRDTLLPKLMSGEINVDDVKID